MHVVPLFQDTVNWHETTNKEEEAYFAQCVLDHRLVGDVARVKGHVVVSLHDVQYRHGVPPSEERLYNMTPYETTAANDQIVITLHVIVGWSLCGCRDERVVRRGTYT